MNHDDESEIVSWRNLSENDRMCVDAFIDSHCGCGCGEAEGSADQGKARVGRLMGLLEHYPVSCCGTDLTRRTMSLVWAHRRSGAASGGSSSLGRLPRLSGEEGLQRGRIHVSMVEILASAACIGLIFSLATAMGSQSKVSSMQQACRGNMRAAAMGFGAYAEDFGGALPLYSQDLPEGNWLQSRANASNLYHLAATGYVALRSLSCPTNPKGSAHRDINVAAHNWPCRDTTSYSYQNVYGKSRSVWNQARPFVVMGDRSPVIDAAAVKAQVAADCVGKRHGCDGQNVLVNDGSSRWLSSPDFLGDNIWLPRNVSSAVLTGTETPVDESDTMLTH